MDDLGVPLFSETSICSGFIGITTSPGCGFRIPDSSPTRWAETSSVKKWGAIASRVISPQLSIYRAIYRDHITPFITFGSGQHDKLQGPKFGGYRFLKPTHEGHCYCTKYAHGNMSWYKETKYTKIQDFEILTFNHVPLMKQMMTIHVTWTLKQRKPSPNLKRFSKRISRKEIRGKPSFSAWIRTWRHGAGKSAGAIKNNLGGLGYMGVS